MTAPDESGFRLRLAEDQLARARRAGAGDPATAVLLARGSIENAAKAALACFTTIGRSHEPGELLRAALGEAAFPVPLREDARGLLARVWGFGAHKHAQTSYGDEAKHLLPSELIDAAQAQDAIHVSESMLDLARRVRQAVLGLDP